MGLFGDIASFAGSFGGELFGKSVDYDIARKLQHDSQDFAAWMYRNRYQMTMEDMKAAGINPILAATGVQPTSGAGLSSVGSMSNPMVTSAQVAKTRAETSEAKSRSKLLRNEAELAKFNKDLAEIEAKRRKAGFERTDRGVAADVMPLIEDMPKAVRGPLRYGITAGTEVIGQLKELWSIVKDTAKAVYEAKKKEFRIKKPVEKKAVPEVRKKPKVIFRQKTEPKIRPEPPEFWKRANIKVGDRTVMKYNITVDKQGNAHFKINPEWKKLDSLRRKKK